MLRKILKSFIVGSVIFFIGGIGGVFLGRYLLPALGENSFLGKYNIFRKMEQNTTIINKKETVVVKDSTSVNEISSKAISSVVTIYSLSPEEKSKKNKFGKTIVSNLLTKRNVEKGVGVALTNDGVIVTYLSDIINKDYEYRVKVFDGGIYPAKLVGVDYFARLAYLKIDGINIPSVSFANMDDVSLGENLIFLGYSESGENSVGFSEGILSDFDATFNLSGQTVASSESLEGVFETTFSGGEKYIGGSVIDYNGDLVGVNGAVNINGKNIYFQIPVDAIQKSMAKLSNGDFEKQAKLGIYYLSIDYSIKEKYGLSVDKGAMIYAPSGEQGLAVLNDSPAQEAGLRIGDIILSIDDKEIDLQHPLSNLIYNYKKGDAAQLKVLRNKKEIEIKINF